MAAKSWSLLTPADDALKNTVPGLIRDVKEHAFTASGFYAEQQSTPDQTIAIYAGIVYFGITKVEYAGLAVADLGTGGAFETTALTASYYNKMLFTIDSAGTLAMTEGTEHAVLASVVEPAIPSGKFPICMVSVQDNGTATAGTILTIEQSEIQQLQAYAFIDVNAAAVLTNNVIVVGDGGVKGVKTTTTPALGTPASGVLTNCTGLPLAGGGSGTTGDSIVKAWIQLNFATATALDSFNVTSITDDGVGVFTITFDVDFANDDYAVAVSGDNYHAGAQTYAVGSIVVTARDALHALIDTTAVSLIAIGDQ